MSKNGLFLISLGGVFIMLSYQMAQPIYLILSGVMLIMIGIYLIKKNRAEESADTKRTVRKG